MIRKGQLGKSRVKVALLVLVAIALLVAASISIEGSTSLFQTAYRAHFEDVVGLKVGAPVRIAGLDVGHVDDVHLVENSMTVEVIFSVENTMTDRLHNDASAVVRAMSVLGDKILVITPGTPTKPMLQPDTVLPGKVELEIAGIAPSAESTMLNLNLTLLEVRQLISSIRKGEGTLGGLVVKDDIYIETKQAIQSVNGITGDLSRLIKTAEAGEGTVGRLLHSPELYDRLMTVTHTMDQLLVRLNQPDGTLAKVATDNGALYQRLDTIAAHGEKIVKKLDTGEGTIGKLLADEEVYTRVEKVLTEVELLIADIQANPYRYFKFSVF